MCGRRLTAAAAKLGKAKSNKMAKSSFIGPSPRGRAFTRQSHTRIHGPRYRDGGLFPAAKPAGLLQRLAASRFSPAFLIAGGLTLILLAVMAMALSSCGGGGATVMMQDFRFVPDTVTIKKGQSVTWTNDDRRSRQVMSGAPPVMTAQFMSPMLEKGQSFSFTFDITGEFPYHDMVIPGATGTVIVQD